MPVSEKLRPLKSLLIVKPSSLGDIVHGLQIVQSVARQWPDCRITWVARDRFAGLVEAAPFVSEVIHYKRKEGWRGLRDVMKILRHRYFEAVWDMQGLMRSGLMTAAAKSPVKLGRRDSRECAGLFYHQTVELPAGEGPHHAIPILQGFPRAAGLDPAIQFPLQLNPGPAFGWQEFFNGDPRKLFVIFTDSRGVGKEWPKFDELTRLIWAEIPGSRVAWCAGKPTEPNVPIPDGRFLNLTGCPMDEMIELVRQPSTFIGNDSGPMHLSAALGNRVLAIFGPTSADRFGPYPPGSPRTESVTAPGGVLADLTPEMVLESLKALLARN
jgi:ADP-heptose:LPS heptosyltransferase